MKFYSVNLIVTNKFKTVFAILFFVMSVSVFSQSSNCNVVLEVVNNETNKKAGESGAYYLLQLTNNSNQLVDYTIKIEKGLNTMSRGFSSIDLETEILGMDLKSLGNNLSAKSGTDKNSTLFLNSGESKRFYVKMITPKGAKIGSVNNSKIIATSNKCINALTTELITEIVEGE